jgi:hypothetical protein
VKGNVPYGEVMSTTKQIEAELKPTEVVRKLDQFVGERFGVPEEASGSQKVYRYLSISKLHGEIGKAKRFELRSVDYVNDVFETKEASIILKDVCEDKNLSDKERAVAQEILDWEDAKSNQVETFILCASEAQDELALWHGYSKENAGVNVEIDVRRLHEAIQKNLEDFLNEDNLSEFYCGKVVYDESTKQEIIAEFLTIVNEAKERGWHRSPEGWNSWLRNYIMPYYRVIQTLFKHGNFATEKEVRYVLWFDEQQIEKLVEAKKLHVEYRHGNLVPVITITLEANQLSQIISKVMVGPHLKSLDENKNNLLEKSIQRHFDEAYPDGLSVEFSQIMLRS